ncbi:MAG: J domain-containing protein [Ruminococcaceae bacterium]|jgi:hypothetical protein|nr:J domain-containing protein [Oscillospiraceae bacterium]
MLSKAECYRILELNPKANSSEIETRYTMLLKRYRGRNDPETIKKTEEITLAYDILTGRYVEPLPIDPRMEKVIFGKKRREWSNIWHYGRLPLLLIIITAVFLGSLIYTIASREDPDFQAVVAGQFATADDVDERVKKYIKDSIDGVEIVEYQYLPLSFQQDTPEATQTGQGLSMGSNPESDYAYLMKMMAIMTGESIEMFVCEQSVYDQYAPQDVFLDLSSLYDRLQDLPADVLAKIKPVRRVLFEDYEQEERAAEIWPDEEAMNADESLPISGLDVTELQLMEGLGLFGRSQILTIGFKAEDVGQVTDFLEYWIRDYEYMHAERDAYLDSLSDELNQ